MTLRPFDRQQLCLRAYRSFVRSSDNFIAEHSAKRLQQRLMGFKREFKHILVTGKVPEQLICGVQELGSKVKKIAYLCFEGERSAFEKRDNITTFYGDEEYLPFPEETFDLILSNMTMHWINDVPGALQQAKRVLRPGGLYIASFYGGSTLKELRRAFLIADSQGPIGVTPRLCEFMDLTTAAQLMQRSGFTDPVVDRSLLEIAYNKVDDLMEDLKNMQETNIMKERPKGLTSRRTFERVKNVYETNELTEQSGILATVELFSLTGWKT
ncbi:MAG: methyltransferase domain-containing protein [Pseudomonadota bacterium]